MPVISNRTTQKGAAAALITYYHTSASIDLLANITASACACALLCTHAHATSHHAVSDQTNSMIASEAAVGALLAALMCG
eukprot:13080-Heterococcus_DN1.PRE.2